MYQQGSLYNPMTAYQSYQPTSQSFFRPNQPMYQGSSAYAPRQQSYGQPSYGQQSYQPYGGGMGGGNSRADAEEFGLSQLYDPDNPTLGMNVAMREMGYSPNAFFSPYMKAIKSAAPGLATAFLAEQAANNGNAGLPDARRGAEMYQNYLRGALRGGIGGTLRHAQANLPQALRGVRGYSEQLDQGAPTTQLNYWAGLLGERLGDQEGRNMPGALLSLQSPFGSSSMRQTYAQALSAARESALTRYYQNLGDDPMNDLAREFFGY